MREAVGGAFAAWIGCLTAIGCAQPTAPPATTPATAQTSPANGQDRPAPDPAADSFIAARRLPASVDCEPRQAPPPAAKSPPHVDGGAPATTSPTVSHDKEIVRRIIRSHTDAVRKCYEAVLIEPPYPRGKVMARILINGGGSVTSTCVASTTLNRLEAERCIVDEALTWKFPKPLGGGVIVVDYPFVLEPAQESN
jgi:hypothetical protein